MQRCLFLKRTLRGRSLCFVLEMLNKVTPPDTYSVQAPSGGVTRIGNRAKVIEKPRSINRDTYHSTYYTTIPRLTPVFSWKTHCICLESDPSEDPSSDIYHLLPAYSPFLSLDDDTTDSDTPDIPPSPTHGTPFTEITASTQRSPIIPRRRVMILSPGQPIPHGRPYHYHLNGPVHMMTARKRVGLLPTHRLAVRHSADHSSSDSSSEATMFIFKTYP
ncbi:hypothetical protein Tco_1329100 [Tanacetum coccineum]